MSKNDKAPATPTKAQLELAYRPKTYSEVIGQEKSVSLLRKKLDGDRFPHTVLFSGPPGTGKTTLARITAAMLKCDPDMIDEMNSASYRGIDTVRELDSRKNIPPLKGHVRVWIMDEVHQFSRDAQNAFLKNLEEPPPWAYFFLCTTDPHKLIDALVQRCFRVNTEPVSDGEIETLLKKIAGREKVSISDALADEIARCCCGSPRQALKLLDNALEYDSEDERLAAITRPQRTSEVVEICSLLLDANTHWKQVAKIINQSKETDWEGSRWMVLAWFGKVLLGGGPKASRAAAIIDAFRFSFIECKREGFSLACWNLTKH